MRYRRAISSAACAALCLLALHSVPYAQTTTVRPSHDYQMKPMETNAKHDAELFFKKLPKGFIQQRDRAGDLLLREYGSMWVAGKGVGLPLKVVFQDEADVAAFQAKLKRSTRVIDGITIELQSPAMERLIVAQAEAASNGLSISPRGGDSARRGYQQTVSLWASRINPGLAHWAAKGKISRQDVMRIKSLSTYEQVLEILGLEQQRIFFAKDLSKSIIYSVAPPGSSQHLSMLALDVKEFNDERVRIILAKHGWYQTVVSDLPHFTFLGHDEKDLPSRGLRLVINSGRRFWIPNLPDSGGAVRR